MVKRKKRRLVRRNRASAEDNNKVAQQRDIFKEKNIRKIEVGDIYIYVDQPALALAISMTIIKINKPLPSIPKSLFFSYRFFIRDRRANAIVKKLANFMDLLEEEEYITSHHTFIYPRELNKYGMYPYIQQRLEKELAYFVWKNKLRMEEIKCYRIGEYIKSNYCYNEKVNGCSNGIKLAFMLGWIKRRVMIEAVWHPLCPQYNWKFNNGRDTWDHVRECLNIGIEPKFHIYDQLKRVAEGWYKRMIRGDMQEEFLIDYTVHPPLWWKELIGDDFLCYLGETRIERLMTVIHGKKPKEFIDNFLNVYPPLLDNEWEDLNIIFQKSNESAKHFKREIIKARKVTQYMGSPAYRFNPFRKGRKD